MELGPIFRAMMRNKIGVSLIAVQIAFTMTVIVNAIFIVNERSALMARPSGLDEANLFYLRSVGFEDSFSEESTVIEDMALLRQTPGIANATVIDSVPLSGSGSSNRVWTDPDTTRPSVSSAYYRVDENAIDTMGLELIAGQNFTAADIEITQSENWSPAKTIISQPLAEELFGGDAANAVGQAIYLPSATPIQVIGVVKQLQAPWSESSMVESTMMVPMNRIDGTSIYLIRTEPGQVNRMMIETEELLANSNTGRILMGLKSLEETREESYRIDSAMSQILMVVIVTLVFINSMGIVGLAIFGINRRRKQIGTRRALGATQGEIIRYFVTENLLITGIGVIVGAALTIGFNIFLVQSFNMPRIDWYYTPMGMLTLILVGLLAVLGPSRGAARIPPALATRSV